MKPDSCTAGLAAHTQPSGWLVLGLATGTDRVFNEPLFSELTRGPGLTGPTLRAAQATNVFSKTSNSMIQKFLALLIQG